MLSARFLLGSGRQHGGSQEIVGSIVIVAKNESAKFWLNVLTELHKRGVKDILIIHAYGLKD